MKANKFFLGLALIGAILTGCEKNPGQTGDYDATSYMSVSIAQAGGTRTAAIDGGFLDGSGNENTINTVDFYFYDADGNAFLFYSNANQGAGNESFVSNRYAYGSGTTGNVEDDPNNIDELLSAVLVINHNKGNIPAYMIAVINSTVDYANKSLSFVKNATVSSNGVNTDGTHIMTNSVYKGADGYKGADHTQIVMETPITIENLAITEAKAKLKPVRIYVERTAARVEVKEKDATKNLVYATGKSFKYAGTNSTINVNARILGWDIVTYANEGTLAKQIALDGIWDAADGKINGFTWNQPGMYRSYWAVADKKTGTNPLTKSFTWSGLLNDVTTTPGTGDIDYCLENTSLPEKNNLYVKADDTFAEDKDISRTNVTKVVIKAQLENASDNTPLTICNWYGSNYATVDELKAAVAQSLKNKLNKQVSGAYTPIEADDIAIVENVGTNMKKVEVGSEDISNQYSYEVYFTFVDPSEQWYELNADHTSYTLVTNAIETIKGVKNARIWTNGMTYYVVNIQHLGANEKDASEEYLPAYYGVVRNHAYEISFSDVSGFGTPVYSATTSYPEPVTPEDIESYVAAEINILSWHVVRQEDVVLGQ